MPEVNQQLEYCYENGGYAPLPRHIYEPLKLQHAVPKRVNSKHNRRENGDRSVNFGPRIS